MARIVRPAWVAVAAASVMFLIALSTSVLQGIAQAPPPPPSAAQIAPFLGDWVVTTAMGGNQMTSMLSVKNDGKPTATIAGEGQPPATVTNISMAGNGLVLRYSIEVGGNAIAAVMTLTPDPNAAAGPLRVQMSIMDGQYEMSGMAAKQLPGAPPPQRGGGFGGGRGPQINETSDFSPKPPYKARSAQEQAKSFILPQGYRMELVASDPDVISPVIIEFDGNGRMYVAEMISYMMDAEATSSMR